MRLPLGFVASSEFQLAPQHAHWFVFRKRELLVYRDATLPRANQLDQLGLHALRTQFLGHLDGVACFSAELAQDAAPPAGMAFVDLRLLYGQMSDELLALSGRAVQVMDWDRGHQFCGACGARTKPHAQARARVCENPACALEHYARVAPAMIVLIERGDELLLARGPHFPTGVFATLAGFVDPGESVEECVHREVQEEVGVRIGNLRYFGSQPWPFPHSLMLGFFADYLSGEIVPQEGEIEHAAFFHIDALPPLFPGRFSVGNQLIAASLARRGRPFPS